MAKKKNRKRLSNQQAELVAECLTGHDGFKVAWDYLVQLDAAPKDATLVEDFLAEMRIHLEEFVEYWEGNE